MLKRPLAAIAATVLVLGLAGCGDDESSTASDQPSNPDGAPCTYVEQEATDDAPEPPADKAAYDGEVQATVSLSAGDLGVTLDADAAPCTVNSFTSLAAQGYFDGIDCHRLSQAPEVQVLQCGDPTGTGGGGPGYSFDDELTGSETYEAGTLAMANAGPDTNGSQFFFVYGTWELPPNYTVFGQVDEADLEVLTGIAAKGVQGGLVDGPPAEAVTIESVTVD
ncbi:peptidylprolyl isomerase [Nocardioides lijunqiniae]|uniref:peptidylprolyl isomerase n=1 Tax=Nocardioides lijunqiniae TaxID=2760832 RepID=UPI0018785B2E|nr:peptidylprolyl isomerase [Nocardioides lijunqiniae]